MGTENQNLCGKKKPEYWVYGVWLGSRVEYRSTFLPCSLVSWVAMSYKAQTNLWIKEAVLTQGCYDGPDCENGAGVLGVTRHTLYVWILFTGWSIYEGLCVCVRQCVWCVPTCMYVRVYTISVYICLRLIGISQFLLIIAIPRHEEGSSNSFRLRGKWE